MYATLLEDSSLYTIAACPACVYTICFSQLVNRDNCRAAAMQSESELPAEREVALGFGNGACGQLGAAPGGGSAVALPALRSNGMKLSNALIMANDDLSVFRSLTGFQVVQMDDGVYVKCFSDDDSHLLPSWVMPASVAVKVVPAGSSARRT